MRSSRFLSCTSSAALLTFIFNLQSLLAMDLTELNTVSRSTRLTTKRWRDLNEDTVFTLTRMRKLNTKKGRSILVELDNSIQTFLPHRSVDFIARKENLYDQLGMALQQHKLRIHNMKKGSFEFQIVEWYSVFNELLFYK